ncbi:MAG TPA: AI-2E family transporter, partial [Acidimicrobiales bacterium]|nr:AI-2E family transporter [Acidimicrobiales bacterium]
MAPQGQPAPVDLDWRSLAWLAASVGGLLVLTALVRSVPRTLAALAVAVIVTLGLDPLVTGLSRRLRAPRGAALAAVLAGFVVAVAVVGVVLVPPAMGQARDLADDLPAVLHDLTTLPVVGEPLERAGVPERLQRTIEALPDRLLGDDTPLLRIAGRAADGLVAAVVTLLFVVTLLLDGQRLLGAARRMVPERHRPRATRVGRLCHQVVGRYV